MIQDSLKAAKSEPPGNNSTGLPKSPHSPERGHSLFPLRHRHQPNQSRLLRRSQRHRIPNPLRPASVLHPLHRLHSIQASAPRSAATGALVPRPCGNGHQHHRASVSGAFLCVLLLPNRDAGAAGYDELEYRYVRGDLPVGYDILYLEREEDVCSAGEDCQAGSLILPFDIPKVQLCGKGSRRSRRPSGSAFHIVCLANTNVLNKAECLCRIFSTQVLRASIPRESMILLGQGTMGVKQRGSRWYLS